MISKENFGRIDPKNEFQHNRVQFYGVKIFRELWKNTINFIDEGQKKDL